MTRRRWLLCGGGGLAALLIACSAAAQSTRPSWDSRSAVAPAAYSPTTAPLPTGLNAAADSKTTLTAGSPAGRLLPARDQGAAERPTSTRNSPSVAPLWGAAAAFLVLGVAITLALAWMRRNGPAVMRPLPNDAVEPLGQRVLGRGVAVHLVRCGGRMLLLGVGPDGIRTLADLSDPTEVEQLEAACRRRDEASAGFAAFAQLLQRGPALTVAAFGDRMSTATRGAGDA